MAIPYLPIVEKCCFFTRNLRLASILILCFSTLSAAHVIAIVLWPTCSDLYVDYQPVLALVLIIYQWLLFVLNLLIILSAVPFLLIIFFGTNLPIGFMKVGLVFTIILLITALNTMVYATCYVTQVYHAQCWLNPTDPLVMYIYGAAWLYFVVVLNTYIRLPRDVGIQSPRYAKDYDDV